MNQFEAVLIRPEGTGTWTYCSVPFRVEEQFGVKGQVHVKGTINGVEYQGILMPHGDGRHYLVVKKSLREAAKVKAGDIVKVVMEKDTQMRTVQIPDDLLVDLDMNTAAKEAYHKLSYSHQKEYVEWINDAKKLETRKNRINQAIEKLIKGQKLK